LRDQKPAIGPDRDVYLIVPFLDAIFGPRGMMMSTIADAETFGALVRTERKSQKLTQEQLAGLAGVGVRFVRELEAGKESCQLGRALQVAQTLGLIVSVSTRRELRP
jgi:y4mF family transcriptional regulator